MNATRTNYYQLQYQNTKQKLEEAKKELFEVERTFNQEIINIIKQKVKTYRQDLDVLNDKILKSIK